MLEVWIIFVGVLFLLSLIMLTRIQVRVAKTQGWSALRRDPFLHYWVALSPLERVLTWCGIAAFILSVFGLTAWTAFIRGAQPRP
jgi:hypothetical protein